MGAACEIPETAAEMAAAATKMTARYDMGYPFSGQDIYSPIQSECPQVLRLQRAKTGCIDLDQLCPVPDIYLASVIKKSQGRAFQQVSQPDYGDKTMSIGTILIIILVIALLGGFSGIGRRSVLRHRLLRWRRPRPDNRDLADPGFARQALSRQGQNPKPKPPLFSRHRTRGSGRSDLVGDHLEARERARAERGHNRDVGGIAPACHQDAADTRLVVAGIERVPAAAEIGFEPGTEVHRWNRPAARRCRQDSRCNSARVRSCIGTA